MVALHPGSRKRTGWAEAGRGSCSLEAPGDRGSAKVKELGLLQGGCLRDGPVDSPGPSFCPVSC